MLKLQAMIAPSQTNRLPPTVADIQARIVALSVKMAALSDQLMEHLFSGGRLSPAEWQSILQEWRAIASEVRWLISQLEQAK